MKQDWPHQVYGVDATIDAMLEDIRRIILCSPTGAGKTLMAQRLIERVVSMAKGVVILTHRKMLIDQLHEGLIEARIDHGVRAKDYEADLDKPVQLCMIQTELSRTVKRQQRGIHKAFLVIVDEGHQQQGKETQKLIKMYLDAGAYVVYLTATPIDMALCADKLIVAGKPSELRAYKTLVPAIIYGPDEPDLRAYKKAREALANGTNLSEEVARHAMMTPGIFGRVGKWFDQLNPNRLPTILFAPGVRESLWFAEQFMRIGITAAHLDGEHIWTGGELERTTTDGRDRIMAGSRSGEIKVICNRWVMREGIDAPWLRHCIIATMIGSLQTFLQIGGRVLRSDNNPDTIDLFGVKECATFQDHGGNYHRHGSFNEDREWFLDLTASMATQMRADRMRTHKQREPFRCPGCGMIWATPTGTCRCGHELSTAKRSRPVVSTDGELTELHGAIYQARRICTDNRGPSIWARMYHRSKTASGARTFLAAEALFAKENKWAWPDRSWPLMPRYDRDRWRKVADVPMDRLT